MRPVSRFLLDGEIGSSYVIEKKSRVSVNDRLVDRYYDSTAKKPAKSKPPVTHQTNVILRDRLPR